MSLRHENRIAFVVVATACAGFLIGPAALACERTYEDGFVSAGGQVNALLIGAEAGWSYVSGRHGADDTGAATGPYLGAFASAGYVMLALRGTFSTFGDERDETLALDLGVKAPIHVSGP